ncbi:Cytochrome c oxidase assembly protein cox19 [Puttea exsequens]|nr:Cytochrome c oxidase assembly protein cox19 [Puttea exsequens]
MSFGGPGGGQKSAKPIPPERGSFPLDHDGECKPIIADYLRCLRRARGTNEQDCRLIAKDYLKCRMDHNLMAPDEFKNLGFADPKVLEEVQNGTGKALAQKRNHEGKQTP